MILFSVFFNFFKLGFVGLVVMRIVKFFVFMFEIILMVFWMVCLFFCMVFWVCKIFLLIVVCMWFNLLLDFVLINLILLEWVWLFNNLKKWDKVLEMIFKWLFMIVCMSKVIVIIKVNIMIAFVIIIIKCIDFICL